MRDLRYALRQLAKSPGFTAVAVTTLALGIGANTAIFSVVNAVLLRPPPFPAPERLVFISERSKDLDHMSVAYPNFLDWRRQPETREAFEGLAAFRGENWNLTGSGGPERIDGLQVSASFFRTLGVSAMRGRVFDDAEDSAGGEPVVVLGEGLWRRQFGGDPSIVERTISLNGEPHTVVGIMPASFQFPRRVEVWTPIGRPAEWTEQRGWHPGIYVVGRLRSGVDLGVAREGLKAVADRLAKAYPDSNTGNGVTVMPLQERFAGPNVRAALGTLLGAVTLVLLIACTNVTHLLLARATLRRREIAVRLALGAGRGTLLRQLLTESLLLAGVGGLAGLLLAYWGIQGLSRMLPAEVLEFVSLGIDRTVLGFSLIVATATGVLFGLAPAWQLAHGKPVESLGEGGRGEVDAGGRGWMRRFLIVAEVAVALVLLVASGLLMRSFGRLQAVPVGLNPANVLTLEVNLATFRYPDHERRVAFYRRIEAAVAALPGVTSAAFVSPLPLGFGGWQSTVRIEGEPPATPGQERLSDVAIVTPDYFRTLGVPVRRGRGFTPADDGRTRVCLVDETFAQKHFGGDALGRRIARGGSGTNWMTIVGVVGHVKNYGAGEDSRIEMYVPLAQESADALTLLVKTPGNPASYAEPIRKAILALDAEQPVAGVRTMESVVARTVADRRLATVLLGLFAGLALVLAAVGLYGVMAFNVAHRTREIGVRMALGADTGDVLRLVLRQGGFLVGIGVLVGLSGAFGATRLLTRLLFQVSAVDPATFVATPVILVAVAFVACIVPAARAARVDPMVALRQ